MSLVCLGCILWAQPVAWYLVEWYIVHTVRLPLQAVSLPAVPPLERQFPCTRQARSRGATQAKGPMRASLPLGICLSWLGHMNTGFGQRTLMAKLAQEAVCPLRITHSAGTLPTSLPVHDYAREAGGDWATLFRPPLPRIHTYPCGFSFPGTRSACLLIDPPSPPHPRRCSDKSSHSPQAH
ncbi:hypothetical protein C8Q74DRAFT_396458 [Fomes fomentarius]|nr:hypothetical protein C8Q74DRAFT_396458 [Fomes fomentarius]